MASSNNNRGVLTDEETRVFLGLIVEKWSKHIINPDINLSSCTTPGWWPICSRFVTSFRPFYGSLLTPPPNNKTSIVFLLQPPDGNTLNSQFFYCLFIANLTDFASHWDGNQAWACLKARNRQIQLQQKAKNNTKPQRIALWSELHLSCWLRVNDFLKSPDDQDGFPWCQGRPHNDG